MSLRPNSELETISKKRGLGFERFYRELHIGNQAQALGWYGVVSPDHIIWLGITLEHAKLMLETMPPQKLNGKLKAAVADAKAAEPIPPHKPPITSRRRTKR